MANYIYILRHIFIFASKRKNTTITL